MKVLKIITIIIMFMISQIDLNGQPYFKYDKYISIYFDTYVPNKYVKENQFISSSVDTSSPPEFYEIKDK
jgi:hypothetical protein